jgi:quaternary ammonium compound-resistance protein SugE
LLIVREFNLRCTLSSAVSTAWTYLIVAGLIEIGWSIGLRYSDGFTKLVPSVLSVIAICVSVYLVALAARVLPIGTAYAVWVGIGATGAALIGIFVLGESASLQRLACLALIVLGVMGLKFVDG